MGKPGTVALHLAQDPEADALLSENPLALLIGMVLDQQVPLEWAFRGPLELARRSGLPIRADALVAVDEETFTGWFAARPSLHRYPTSMAQRVRALCSVVLDRYGGDAANIWQSASSGAELVSRLRSLPGFGEQKAKIFVALLGKQLGVRPPGWEAASAPFSEPGARRSVADIVDEASLAAVRNFKRDLKASARKTGT